MKRLLARRHEEDGAVLLIALGFLTFIGVVAAVLLSYATSSIGNTISVRDIRSREYAADAVVEMAINKVRSTPASSNSSNCAAATVNGLSLRADCSDPGNTTTDVTITACSSTAASPCPASAARLVAKVKYTRSVTPAAVVVVYWSARR